MKILHAFVFFSIKHAGGTSDLMYKIAGLDSKSIEAKILDTLDSNIVLQKQK